MSRTIILRGGRLAFAPEIQTTQLSLHAVYINALVRVWKGKGQGLDIGYYNACTTCGQHGFQK